MDFTKYVNPLTLPQKADFLVKFWYRAGKCVATKVGNKEPEILDPFVGLLGVCTMETVQDTASFQIARDAYHRRGGEIMKEFKRDLFADLGISGHPKRDKMYSLAWEYGHSGGLAEVYDYALNLVELMN